MKSLDKKKFKEKPMCSIEEESKEDLVSLLYNKENN